MTGTSSTPPTHQPSDGTGSGSGWRTVPPQPAPHTFTQPPVPSLPPTGPAPSRRKVWLTHGATALVALVVGASIGGGGKSGGAADSARPAPAVTVTKAAAGEPKPAVTVTETVKATVTAKPKPVKKPGPPSSFSGEGQYLVGEDIQAGTYRTSGPEKDSVIPNCYWARLKNASGEFDAIIANDNIQGQGRVTVNKGEYFKTSGCQDWQKVG
ncbi:hypothetical protein ABZ619_27515 [Streptomyces sp. NPDC007851]|uniref:hypothetical protein n=1 Tax=Streptomyces sp. NPDC007851 TaxID=3155008 RepID=UPI00340D2DFD